MHRMLRLMLLLLILVEVVSAGLSFYLSATSQAAISRELEAVLGSWGDWITPWLFEFSPSLGKAVGGYFHARANWGWSWPAALLYGFPGLLIAAVALFAGLGRIAWRAFHGWRAARRALPGEDAPGEGGAQD